MNDDLRLLAGALHPFGDEVGQPHAVAEELVGAVGVEPLGHEPAALEQLPEPVARARVVALGAVGPAHRAGDDESQSGAQEAGVGGAGHQGVVPASDAGRSYDRRVSAAPPETRARVGVVVPPSLPAGHLVPFVRRVEELGFDELWVVEDCFLHGGVAQAATALAVTAQLPVGLGVLPVGARNVAYAALEVATLAGLHPGRLTVGVGHGMGSWNDQVGAAVDSPLTLLREYLDALRALLRGEEVTTRGRYVALDHVRLAHPPRVVPPLLAGVRGPRSMRVAAGHADGVLLAEPTTPPYVDAVRRLVGPDATLVAYQVAGVAPSGSGRSGEQAAIGAVRPALRFAADPAWAAHLADLPFADELAAHVAAAASVDEAVATLPADWVRQLAVTGTPEQARTRLQEVADAGVALQALYPVGEDPLAALDTLAPLVHP